MQNKQMRARVAKQGKFMNEKLLPGYIEWWIVISKADISSQIS